MIKAIADRIFVRLEPQEKTSHLIIDSLQNPRVIGRVESVGERVNSVKPGDKILFHLFDELPSHQKDVVVLRENSILGVFENE